MNLNIAVESFIFAIGVWILAVAVHLATHKKTPNWLVEIIGPLIAGVFCAGGGLWQTWWRDDTRGGVLFIVSAVLFVVGGLISLIRRRRIDRVGAGSFKYPPDHPLHTWTKGHQ